MRKFGIKFAAHHPNEQEVKKAFIQCVTMDDWRNVIEQFYGAASAPMGDVVGASF
jgi:hypothetical protein